MSTPYTSRRRRTQTPMSHRGTPSRGGFGSRRSSPWGGGAGGDALPMQSLSSMSSRRRSRTPGTGGRSRSRTPLGAPTPDKRPGFAGAALRPAASRLVDRSGAADGASAGGMGGAAARADPEKDCWVMVTGIESAEAAEAARERLVSRIGTVEDVVEGEGNWIYVRFATLSQKQSAVEQSRNAQLVVTVRGAQKIFTVVAFTHAQQIESNFRARDRDRSHVARTHDGAQSSGRLRGGRTVTPSRFGGASGGGRQRRWVNGQMVVDDIADSWRESSYDDGDGDGVLHGGGGGGGGGGAGGGARRTYRGDTADSFAVRHRNGMCEKIVELCAALWG